MMSYVLCHALARPRVVGRGSVPGAEPGWAGSDAEYIGHEARVTSVTVEVEGPWLEVRLPAGTQVTLTLRLRMGARLPSLRTPWS